MRDDIVVLHCKDLVSRHGIIRATAISAKLLKSVDMVAIILSAFTGFLMNAFVATADIECTAEVNNMVVCGLILINALYLMFRKPIYRYVITIDNSIIDTYGENNTKYIKEILGRDYKIISSASDNTNYRDQFIVEYRWD